MVRRTFVGLLLLSFGPFPSASAQSRGFQPEDYYKIVTVSEATVSPTGQYVAFTVTPVVEKENTRPLEMGVLVLAPSLETGSLAATPVAGDFNLLAGEILTAEGVVESLLETDGSDPMPAKGKGIQRVFPNPFNPSVTIEYALDHPARVSLQIHDLAGRLIATLVDEYQIPQGGNLSAVWDGNNSQGRRSSSGLYFWRLAIRGQVETGRMLMIE